MLDLDQECPHWTLATWLNGSWITGLNQKWIIDCFVYLFFYNIRIVESVSKYLTAFLWNRREWWLNIKVNIPKATIHRDWKEYNNFCKHLLSNLYVINKLRFLGQIFLVRKRWVHETDCSTRINGSCKQSIDHKTQLK